MSRIGLIVAARDNSFGELHESFYRFTVMKRKLNGVALLCFIVALIIGVMTDQDVKDEGEFVKSFRDPDRVDQRWLLVTGFGTAAFCFSLWSMYARRTES